jgi:endonuclease/exonuclease/phosphatase family metal-dependent hydrolase
VLIIRSILSKVAPTQAVRSQCALRIWIRSFSLLLLPTSAAPFGYSFLRHSPAICLRFSSRRTLQQMSKSSMEQPSSSSRNASPPTTLSPSTLRRKRLAALCPDDSSSIHKRRAEATTPSTARKLFDVIDLSTSPDVSMACTSKEDNNGERKKKRGVVTNPYPEEPTAPSDATQSSTTKKAALSAPKTPSSRVCGFQVASYNLWFGPQQNGEPHASARMKEVHRLVVGTVLPPVWFIGFQEVVPSLAKTLFPLLQQSGYQITRQQGVAYGVALAIQTQGPDSPTLLESGWHPYDDDYMARGFLFVRARLPGSQHEVLFCTTHLESYMQGQVGKPAYTGAPQRARQLQHLESFCRQHMQDHENCQTAILTGDMNWDDERRNPMDQPILSVLNMPSWKDAFLETANAKEKGYTYDGKLNPMLSNSLRRRFDRCLVLSTVYHVSKTRLIGTEPIPNLMWPKYNPWNQTSKTMPTAPSDHFGLIVEMQAQLF